MDHNTAKLLTHLTANALAAQGHSIPNETTVDVQLVYRPSGARSFVNFDQVQSVLRGYCKDKGLRFEVSQSSGRFLEQVTLFRAAKILVAAHGASLTNVIWMHPNAAVVWGGM